MRVAARIQELNPSATLVMAARAAELRRQGRPIISFTTGEPDFDTPGPIKAAAEQAIRDGFTKYTPAGGIPELREAIARRLERDYGIRYGRDEVVVSCGAKQAIFNALMALCDPGDEVITFSPYWTSYPEMIRCAGGTPVIVPTRAEDGFVPDPGLLEAALTEKTRVIIINSPNNPTGAVYPEEALQGLAEAVHGREIAFVTDDIYDRLVYGGKSFASVTAAGERMRERTIVVGGVSKTYAMTGWRIGYAAGPPEVIAAMETIQSQTTSGAASISQMAALAALRGPDDEVETMRREYDRRRKAMLARLRGIPGVEVTEPMGAFFTFPRCTALYGRRFRDKEVQGSIALAEALLEGADLAVVPGAAFGDDGAIRLSYALSFEAMEEGLDRLKRFFSEALQ